MHWGAIPLMLWILLCSAASAGGDIVLRAAVKPAEAWVGQRVVLQIDVLGADGWAQIGRFGEMDLPGAYLIRTDSQGTRLQENIDGVSYTGQRYEVSVYPQKAGVIEVPPLPVDVAIKTWGADAAQALRQERTPAVAITAKLPPGVKEIRGLISTTAFLAEQRWSADTAELKVGDALQRTITMQAEDVSGMAFAPLEFAELPGLGIYPAEPELADSADRGSLRGRRTEAVTYVFERAGVVQIPDIQLSWWNVSAQKLEAITLRGREFEIGPGPVGTAGTPAVQRFGVQDLWLPGALVSVAIVFLLRFGRPLMRRWYSWRRRRRESEPRYFKRALQSVRSKNPRLALRDIMRWLDRIHEGQRPVQLEAFVRRHADADARVAVNRLLDAVATDGRLADPATLIRVLTAMRTRWRKRGQRGSDAAFVLPDLNG
jgi:hypothetical protein